MNSVRIKLTVALLAMSFVAIAAVGITARAITLDRLDQLVISRAVHGFKSEITDYCRTYGSLEKAREAEPFFQFVRRTRPGPQPRENFDGPPLEGRAAPRPFPLGGKPPGFLIVDRKGRAVLPLGGREVGEQVPAGLLDDAQPLVIDGVEVGLLVSLGRPELTEAEERYLSAIHDSWLYSLLIAAVLAIPFGFALGGRLAAPLREMTGAVRAMRRGELRQKVRVRSRDEVGLLAETFNQMSSDLADAYDALKRSNAQISEQAAQLSDLSRRDELTRIPNRRAFDEQAEQVFSHARRYLRPFTVALVDIDHFKGINDRFSHAAGDAVLRTIAEAIRANIRDSDLVARIGGDEFAILFPETGLEEGTRLAARVLELIRNRDWSAIAPELMVTISAGLCADPALSSMEEMLKAADAKLYEAKRAGGDRACR